MKNIRTIPKEEFQFIRKECSEERDNIAGFIISNGPPLRCELGFFHEMWDKSLTRKYTNQELQEIIADEQAAIRAGWNVSAIKKIIASTQ